MPEAVSKANLLQQKVKEFRTLFVVARAAVVHGGGDCVEISASHYIPSSTGDLLHHQCQLFSQPPIHHNRPLRGGVNIENACHTTAQRHRDRHKSFATLALPILSKVCHFMDLYS